MNKKTLVLIQTGQAKCRLFSPISQVSQGNRFRIKFPLCFISFIWECKTLRTFHEDTVRSVSLYVRLSLYVVIYVLPVRSPISLFGFMSIQPASMFSCISMVLGPLRPLLLFNVYWVQLHLYGFKSTPSAFTLRCLLGCRSIRFASTFISPFGCFHPPVSIPTLSIWRPYSSFPLIEFIPPSTTPARLPDSRILSYSILCWIFVNIIYF